MHLTALNVAVHSATTVPSQERAAEMGSMLTNHKPGNKHVDMHLPTISNLSVGGNDAEYKLLV